MSQLVTLDWLLIALYFVVLLGVALATGRKQGVHQSTAGYFLAGRDIGWFVVGAALFASNIGSEHLVGLAGTGYDSGVAVGQFEVLASLILLRLFLGLGESIAFPGSSKIFAAEVPAERRGIANASVSAALAFGPALGVLFGGAILGEWGWRAVFWIFGVVTLFWLIPWQIVAAPLRAQSIAAPPAERVSMTRLLRVPTLWRMGLVHFLSNYGFYFLLAWLPNYLVRARGLAITDMTLLATLGYAAQAIAAIGFGLWSDHWTRSGRSEGAIRRGMMVVTQIVQGIASRITSVTLRGYCEIE